MVRALVDLQVNGFAGVDFASAALTRSGIARVCATLLERGTSGFLATVITTAWPVYEHVLPLLADAVTRPPAGARVLGIHLEGPFISAEPGAVGAHPRQHVQAPSLAAFDRLRNLADGSLALLTLAPEIPGALVVARAAVRAGVVVATGHTLACDADMQAAVSTGARLITHLGNGCPTTLPRHDNPIVTQLASGLQPMIIADGQHLPPAFVRLVARVTGRNGLIAVSDASPVAGLPPGDYESFGTPVRLEASGRLVCRDRDALAGSSVALLQCLNWLAAQGWTEPELWAAGRDNALAVLRRSRSDLPDAGVVWRDDQFAVGGTDSPPP